MNDNRASSKQHFQRMKNVSPDLQLAFDVGHSSIGWAVLNVSNPQSPALLGCGSVIFQADDCLASTRRGFRRQRRHIRATRLRIARLKALVRHLGVLAEEQLDAVVTSSPWQLAARVLRGGNRLSWPELWDVIRWYAHNRGYDGNKAWSRHEADAAAEKEDTEKVERAKGLLAEFAQKHGRPGSMAEVWCDLSGLDPLGAKTSCHLPGSKRPKGQNAAFPREQIEREVAAVLRAHIGELPSVDETLIRALMTDWRAISCPAVQLPARYRGGLLFGQLVPRFENRIIARCPITYERIYRQEIDGSGDEKRAKHEAEKRAKVPAAGCPEFFRYRWAMQLANVQIAGDKSREPRRLTSEERQALDRDAHQRGAFTKLEFKKAVRALTGGASDNLDQMLLHPDADKALVVDPAARVIAARELAAFHELLPERFQKRLRGQLRHERPVSLLTIRAWLDGTKDLSVFDAEVDRRLSAASTRRTKSAAEITRESLLGQTFKIEPVSGRAPHSREVMREVVEFVLKTNRHPAEEGGPLFRSEAIRHAQLQRNIDEQTNNHLVRHRLRILERLHADLLKAYAGDDSNRIGKITIEVNRELKDLSGKTAKQVAQDLGQRLSNFKNVSEKLEAALAGKNIRIGPGLIRKARIAEDLGWRCPFTGKDYDVFDLLERRVDKDHIVPRSERPSDSLDSLVITFGEVNRMKGKRTAVKFIEDCGGQTVPGAAQLSIKTLANFHKDVEKLDTFRGHDDDKRRKKNRQRLLLLRDYVEKEFVPGDLTQTSQLVRLGAQALQRHYLALESPPVVTSLPGSVTGAVRKSWDLLGCLSLANPLVMNPDDLDANGQPRVRTKTEIRDITHLHHALDACTLAFATVFLPRDGGAWELLVRRRLNEEDQIRARQVFKDRIQIEANGTLRLTDLDPKLKEQIRQRLAERRVVQHIPSDMSGLHAELNAWRVIGVEEGEATLHQRMRQPDGTRPLKSKKEKTAKLIGLRPGKLNDLKAALIIADNYGLALDPEPTIIPFHKVWVRLRELREKNGGKPVRVLRNGMLIEVPRGIFAGVWRIFSVKNNATGIALDMGRPDVVRLKNKTDGHKINVLLSSLLKQGVVIGSADLMGLSALRDNSRPG